MTSENINAAHELAGNYIACWNETDGARRRVLLAQHWTPEATYVDPLMQGAGLAAIDALMAAVFERFPGHSFTLKDGAEAHHGRLRFSWSLGPNDHPGAAPVVEGTDFAELDEAGRFVAVTGFLDKVNLP